MSPDEASENIFRVDGPMFDVGLAIRLAPAKRAVFGMASPAGPAGKESKADIDDLCRRPTRVEQTKPSPIMAQVHNSGIPSIVRSISVDCTSVIR